MDGGRRRTRRGGALIMQDEDPTQPSPKAGDLMSSAFAFSTMHSVHVSPPCVDSCQGALLVSKGQPSRSADFCVSTVPAGWEPEIPRLAGQVWGFGCWCLRMNVHFSWQHQPIFLLSARRRSPGVQLAGSSAENTVCALCSCLPVKCKSMSLLYEVIPQYDMCT